MSYPVTVTAVKELQERVSNLENTLAAVVEAINTSGIRPDGITIGGLPQGPEKALRAIADAIETGMENWRDRS